MLSRSFLSRPAACCVTGLRDRLAGRAGGNRRCRSSPISAPGTWPRPLPGYWPCSRASASAGQADVSAGRPSPRAVTLSSPPTRPDPRFAGLHSARTIGTRCRSCPACGHAAHSNPWSRNLAPSLMGPLKVCGHGHHDVAGTAGSAPSTADDERLGEPVAGTRHASGAPLRVSHCQRGSPTVSAHPAGPQLRQLVSS